MKKMTSRNPTPASRCSMRSAIGSLVWLFFFSFAIMLTALSAQGSSAGEQAAESSFSEKIEVREVLLDVLVTDRDGQVVLGLDEDDFVVREDGEPADIQSVTFYGNSQLLSSSDAARRSDLAVGSTSTRRYFILFFHHQGHLLPRLGANLLDAGRRAKQWVKGSLSPNDYVAVVSYFPKFNLLDFTNDADILTRIIDQAVQRQDFTLEETGTSSVASLSENLPAGDVDRIYEALAMTAEATKEVRGRKNLIFFSIGFGRVDGFGFYLPDQRFYPDLIKTFNDNNVAVYPVDLLASDLSPFFTLNRFDHTMTRMALETGGHFYFNFVNYLAPLEWVAQDNSGYYLISFKPTQEHAKGTYQEIDVETLNANYDVRSREGYVVGDVYPYGESRGDEAGR